MQPSNTPYFHLSDNDHKTPETGVYKHLNLASDIVSSTQNVFFVFATTMWTSLMFGKSLLPSEQSSALIVGDLWNIVDGVTGVIDLAVLTKMLRDCHHGQKQTGWEISLKLLSVVINIGMLVQAAYEILQNDSDYPNSSQIFFTLSMSMAALSTFQDKGWKNLSFMGWCCAAIGSFFQQHGTESNAITLCAYLLKSLINIFITAKTACGTNQQTQINQETPSTPMQRF